MRLSVVVPAYREAGRIAATVAELRAALMSMQDSGGAEVVVADDGSDDGTAAAARAAGADTVVEFEANQGKGAAVRAGIEASRGAVVAFTDADLAYAPQQILRLLAEVESGADIVVGNRRHPDSVSVTPPLALRRAGSRIVVAAARGLLGLRSRFDTQCGLKGFRRPAALSLAESSVIDRFAFDIEMLYLAEHWGLEVREIPVEVRNRQGSSVRMLRDGLRLVFDMARIRCRAILGRYPPKPHCPGQGSE